MWPLTNSRIELLRTLFRRCPERRELADSKWVEHYNVCLMIVVTGDMDDRWRWDIIALAWGLFGLLRVFGYEAMVERFLELEVTGLDQDGQPIKMEKGTFGTVLNHKLPLAKSWPQQSVR
ncbi:hypothetical protein Tco_0150668 [Tanacetum coccineum]